MIIPDLYEEEIHTRLAQLHAEAELQHLCRRLHDRTPWRHAVAVALVRLAAFIEPNPVSVTRTN